MQENLGAGLNDGCISQASFVWDIQGACIADADDGVVLEVELVDQHVVEVSLGSQNLLELRDFADWSTDGIVGCDEVDGCNNPLACNYNEDADGLPENCVFAANSCQVCSDDLSTDGTGFVLNLDVDGDTFCGSADLCDDPAAVNFDTQDEPCAYSIVNLKGSKLLMIGVCLLKIQLNILLIMCLHIFQMKTLGVIVLLQHSTKLIWKCWPFLM